MDWSLVLFFTLVFGVGFVTGFIVGVITLYVYAASRGFKKYKEQQRRHEEFMVSLEQELVEKQNEEAEVFAAFQAQSPHA